MLETTSLESRPVDHEDGNESTTRSVRSASPSLDTFTEAELRRNRIFMTICNYLLSYPRYSFSLFVILATRSLPLPTWKSGFQQPLRAVRSVAREESHLYMECAHHTFQSLEKALNRTAEEEWRRIAHVRTRNADLIALAQLISQTCVNASMKAQRAIHMEHVDKHRYVYTARSRNAFIVD
jgi:hypothetical protein